MRPFAAGLAQQIVDARADGRVLAAPADHGLTPAEAYAIQAEVLASRLAAGGGVGGWKLGYTSQAMREQMGIAEPNFGPLARAMILPAGATLRQGITQPKAEPEIAAVIARPVPAGADVATVRSCVAEWRIALEVVDSVWADYRFDWSLNTADGSSAAFVVLGPALAGARGWLPELPVELRRNGELVGRGHGSAAMGDPAVALHWLVGQLAERGLGLRPKDVVITGGITPAVPLEPGDRIEAMAGEASVRVLRAR